MPRSSTTCLGRAPGSTPMSAPAAPIQAAATPSSDRTVVARVAQLIRPRRVPLALGIAASVLASASAVALLAAGAWLIARASQHPPIVALSVAVVGVRAFAVGRAVFRYVERLVTHDATLRLLGDLRVTVWSRLGRLPPGGGAGGPRGGPRGPRAGPAPGGGEPCSL